MSDVSSNMQPPQTPWDNSEVLRREPDEKSAGTGPQGASTTVTRDSLIPPGPSQQGLPGSPRDESFMAMYNSASPQLVAPHTLIADLATYKPQIKGMLDNFANFATNGNAIVDIKEQDIESFFSILQQPDQNKSTSSQTTAKPQQEQFSKGETPPDGKTQGEASPEEAPIYGPEGEMLNGLYSTDYREVKEALSHFMGIDKLPKNQQDFFERKLANVAHTIALQNTKGDIAGLLSQKPEEVSKTLTELISQSNVEISPEDKEVFNTCIQNFGKTVSNLNTEAANPPPINYDVEISNYVKEMASTDPNVVYQALLLYSDPKGHFKTPGDVKRAEAALLKLAALIAKQNETGGIPDLKSFDPATVSAALQKLLNDSGALSGTNDDWKSQMGDFVGNIGENIAPLNAASGAEAPQNPIFSSMNGTDPQAILDTLISLTGVDKSKLTPDQLASLQQLSVKIAEENKAHPEGIGLESPAVGTIKAELTKLMGDNISPDMTKLLATISSHMAPINLSQWQQLTLSTDPKVVEKALDKLANLEYRTDLSPSDKAYLGNYLKIMAIALAFMSKIRAEISIMNAKFTQSEAIGKQKNIADQTRMAEKAYTEGMKQIQTWLDSKLASLSQSTDFMKIFGPILTVVMAIIAVVVICVTSGAGTAVGIALICATVAIATFTVLDATLNIMDRLIAAMGVDDPILASVLKMVFMCAITLITIIASGGAAAVCTIEQITMKAIMEALKQVLMSFLTRGMALATTVAMVGTSILSSGAINTTLMEALKKMGLDEKTAMIISTVMMMLLMILFLMTCMAAGSGGGAAAGGKTGLSSLKSLFGSAGGAEKGAASAGASGAKGATAGAEEELAVGGKSIAQQTAQAERTAANEASAAKAAKPIGGVGVKSIDEGAEAIEKNLDNGFIIKMLNNIATRMKETIKDPQNYVDLLQLLGGMLQAAGNIEQGEFDLKMAKLNDSQASLERITSQCQAMLEFLKGTITGFDINIEAINEDSKKLATFVNDLCKLFAQMVEGMSDSMTKLHQTS